MNDGAKLHVVRTSIKDWPWLIRRDGESLDQVKVGQTRFEAIIEGGNLKNHYSESVQVLGIHK